MATPRKKWPQTSEWARLESISLAEQSYRILDALVDELENTNHLRQLVRVLNNLKEIRFILTVCKDEKNLIEEKNK